MGCEGVGGRGKRLNMTGARGSRMRRATAEGIILICMFLLARPSVAVSAASPPVAGPADAPWMRSGLSADARAALLAQQLSLDEALQLLQSRNVDGADWRSTLGHPAGSAGGAGYTPGIARLGIPALQETDSELGVSVANFGDPDHNPVSTAFPSGDALAATWDPQLMTLVGRTVGREARAYGFNVVLGPALNLARDPRGGRNWEFMGEDPLLSGWMAGSECQGLQSVHVICVLKHLVMNDYETGQWVQNAQISWDALEESDLLAFRIAIEHGHPGALMCAYDKVNGIYSCENRRVLDEIVKRQWKYPGWIMSDWGAVHSTVEAANAGLDQESGLPIDERDYFGEPLRAAVAAGTVARKRIYDMARRILRSMFVAGLFDQPGSGHQAVDWQKDAGISERAAEEGMVLLRNQGALLPLKARGQSILVVGGMADFGVKGGEGAAQVHQRGEPYVYNPRWLSDPANDAKGKPTWDSSLYLGSSPLRAIRAMDPGARVQFDPGEDLTRVVHRAANADVAIVFAVGDGAPDGTDLPSLHLPNGQDQLITAISRANPHTVVVLETSGPIVMPWLSQVAAVIEAWYPGGSGGPAIANVLFGKEAPGGRLPVTFPADVQELPRAKVPDADAPIVSRPGTWLRSPLPFTVTYAEGSAVGYRWFADHPGDPVVFPFGFGLTYTRFQFSGLTLAHDKEGDIVAHVTVRNIGRRPGVAVAEFYETSVGKVSTRRLAGFARVPLDPGQSREVAARLDQRVLANYDAARQEWRIPAGTLEVAVGDSAIDLLGKASMRFETGVWLPKPKS